MDCTATWNKYVQQNDKQSVQEGGIIQFFGTIINTKSSQDTAQILHNSHDIKKKLS